jgi:hypothetical protein
MTPHPNARYGLTDEQKANLRKWVEALESGRYKQTTGSLHKIGYCCLGVWCQIREGGKWIGRGATSKDYAYVGDIEEVVLEDAMLDAFLRDELGITTDEESDFIDLNDHRKANFRPIAAAIRKNHPDVFRESS